MRENCNEHAKQKEITKGKLPDFSSDYNQWSEQSSKDLAKVLDQVYADSDKYLQSPRTLYLWKKSTHKKKGK